MTADDLTAFVRSVPDYPARGVIFRDLSPLLANAQALRLTVEALAEKVRAAGASKVAGMEARGFIFGAAVAVTAGCGFVPIRKAGKLPVAAIGIDYALEYGRDRLELDPSMINPADRVAIVDDLVATGGTALAAVDLIARAGASVVTAEFVIELTSLGGGAALRARDIPTAAVLTYA
jgi:adenine phosphoribosyltransferase